MDSRFVLALVAVGLAATRFGLAGADADPHGDAPSAADPATAPTQATRSGWAGAMTLERAADGHFYAEVEVEGRSARMLVDTGASMIALTGADAEAMGLYWDDADVTVIGKGASGPVHGVATRLPLVRLGAFEARDVRAVIVPEGLGVSLLGQSFLATLDRVEIAADRLQLEDAG